MNLADKWGKPLFELLPDKFPQGRLTDVELELWARFYNEKRNRVK